MKACKEMDGKGKKGKREVERRKRRGVGRRREINRNPGSQGRAAGSAVNGSSE